MHLYVTCEGQMGVCFNNQEKEASMRLTNHLLHANYAAKRLVVFSSGADVAGLSDFLSLLQSKMFNSMVEWTSTSQGVALPASCIF